MVRLGGAAVARTRLRAQRLGSLRALSADEVPRVIVAVQAQDMAAAALAIRARSSGLVAGDVDDALADRRVAVTWSLRRTRHLHAVEDVAWIRSLVEPVFNRPTARDRELGVAGEAGEQGIAALRRALESEGTLDRARAKEILAPAGIDVAGQAPIHLLARAAFEGLLVIVPTPGATQALDRYALAETLLPALPRVDPDRALVWLAERYLAAYGPATPDDLASWSGLARAQVSRAWAGVADRLAEVEVEGSPGRLWLLASTVGAVREAAEAPLRLAGGFDPLLLGYADRALHLAPEFARLVNRGGGIIRPVVLTGGRVAGTWAWRRRPFGVAVSPFPGAPIDGEAVAAEANDIERFLAL